MDNITFNKKTHELNKAYYDIFGVVPCIQGFACSREEYIDALEKAVTTNTIIEKLLPKEGTPLDSDVIL